MKILLTGGTGLIGKEIGKKLVRDGFDVVVISRDQKKAKMQLPFPAEVIEGDLSHGPIKNFPTVDAVIHLVGESVAEGRWSEERKKRIYDSRIVSTKNLKTSLKNQKVHLLSASAIGVYPDSGDQDLIETSPAGDGFLAIVCKDWEAEAAQIGQDCTIFRIGIVLSEHGGALEKMLFPFRAGLGGALGSGEQWMSWIHIDDLSEAFLWALKNKKFGVFNAVSPHPARNKEFSQALAKALHRPLGLNVPKLALKFLYGEMASVILSSQKVRPNYLIKEKFSFQFTDLQQTLSQLCKAWGEGEDLFFSEQYLPKKIEEIFPFFSAAENLESITPSNLSFKIQKVSTPEIQKGTLIDYRLKIRGVPVKWRTEIAAWEPGKYFVDQQLVGPYKLWHHTHDFQKMGLGTLMTDRVRYRSPMGFLGWLVAGHLVQKEISGIFNYRRKVIFEKFFKT